MRKNQEFVYLGLAILLILAIVLLVPACVERNTFNKFKRPDQPEATLLDALCSELRITN